MPKRRSRVVWTGICIEQLIKVTGKVIMIPDTEGFPEALRVVNLAEQILVIVRIADYEFFVIRLSSHRRRNCLMNRCRKATIDSTEQTGGNRRGRVHGVRLELCPGTDAVRTDAFDQVTKL